MRTCILSGAQVRDKIIWANGMLMVRFFRIASVLFRAKVLREILALFCASSTNSRLIYLGFLPRSLRCPAHCHCMRVMLTCCCVVPLTLVCLQAKRYIAVRGRQRCALLHQGTRGDSCLCSPNFTRCHQESPYIRGCCAVSRACGPSHLERFR